MGPNQTYKLLHSKGKNKQKEKITYRLGKSKMFLNVESKRDKLRETPGGYQGLIIANNTVSHT